MITHEPPSKIDEAKVIEWAWSGDTPFGEVKGTSIIHIFGLVIATYDDNKYYRFSCDKEWETQQDEVYDTISEAKNQLPDQYRSVDANWIKR